MQLRQGQAPRSLRPATNARWMNMSASVAKSACRDRAMVLPLWTLPP